MTTPTITEIRAAIKTRVATASGADKVYDYERYSKEQAALATLYKTSGNRLHGYYIRRLRTRELHIDIGRYVVDHTWLIRGFMSLDDADASEKTFDTTIEAICTAFRTNSLVMADVETCFAEDGDAVESGIQVLETGPVMFSGVLCHSARLGLTTRHFI